MTRNTGPAPATVAAVRDRDGGCVRCGSQSGLTTQHRVARGMGGTREDWINEPPNLLTLCGSGTTGCHGWTEHHPDAAKARGWAVSHYVNPRDVAVLYRDGWWMLDDDGGRSPSAGRHAGSSPRRWGHTLDDPHMGRPWPPPPQRTRG